MSEPKHIRNLTQLRQEMALLKQSYQTQGQSLKEDANTYVKGFSISNLLKKVATPGNLLAFDEKINITGRIMSLILPVLINKTLFRNAGFITRTITAFTANKLGKSISFDKISGLINMFTSLIKSTPKKTDAKNELVFTDYGIPADSETF